MNHPSAVPFRDRADAGRALADHLIPYQADSKVLVLALPRGGVAVAAEVAHSLNLPLDVYLVRKLAVPNRPDVTMGLIASGGVEVLDRKVIREERISSAMIATATEYEQGELRRRERTYRGMRPMLDIEGNTVILIDDGLTTGATMLTAISALREARPERIIAAAPVGAPSACDLIRRAADEVVCLFSPDPMQQVARWYRDYSPVMDREIREILDAFEAHSLAQYAY
jgi:predicted phosphoribosyltransferase